MKKYQIMNGGNILRISTNSKEKNGLHDDKKYQIIYADP